jgi:hypothetical protein
VSTFAEIPEARSGTRLFAGRTENVTDVRSYLATILDGCPIAEDVILCGSELFFPRFRFVSVLGLG